MTLVAYLITDNVMAVAEKMQKELRYSTKVRECSMMCGIGNHPRVVSTLHNDISYKLHIVKSINQISMDGRCFHIFSDALKWATGGCVTEASSTAIRKPEIKRIERNIKKGALYTTVIWEDDSKPTVVKCAEDDSPDIYFAVASAIAIKMYGSNSAYKRMIKDKTEETKQWK